MVFEENSAVSFTKILLTLSTDNLLLSSLLIIRSISCFSQEHKIKYFRKGQMRTNFISNVRKYAWKTFAFASSVGLI